MLKFFINMIVIVITFSLLTVNVLLFKEPRLYSAHATSRSLIFLCGTVRQLTFDLHQLLCRLLSED